MAGRKRRCVPLAAQVVTLRTPPRCRCAAAADARGALPHKKAGRLPVTQAFCGGAAEARAGSPRERCCAGAVSTPVRCALVAIALGSASVAKLTHTAVPVCHVIVPTKSVHSRVRACAYVPPVRSEGRIEPLPATPPGILPTALIHCTTQKKTRKHGPSMAS